MSRFDEEQMGVGFADSPGGVLGPGGAPWPKRWGEAPFDAESRAKWIYTNARRDHRHRLSPAEQLTLAAIDSFVRYDNMIRIAELNALKDGP